MDTQNRVFRAGPSISRMDAPFGRPAGSTHGGIFLQCQSGAFENSVLMPGLINAHAIPAFLRGTAEHLPVWDWLTLHINPMHRVLQPHRPKRRQWLCYAESVLGGTTTVVDMWRFMEGSAKAAEEVGNRLVAVPYVGEHPEYNYFDTLERTRR